MVSICYIQSDKVNTYKKTNMVSELGLVRGDVCNLSICSPLHIDDYVFAFSRVDMAASEQVSM